MCMKFFSLVLVDDVCIIKMIFISELYIQKYKVLVKLRYLGSVIIEIVRYQVVEIELVFNSRIDWLGWLDL